MKKTTRLLFSILLVAQLFPTSSIFAETVQYVPGGETTISSKAEDPLKEYKEKVNNQVLTIESDIEEETPTSEAEIKEEVPEADLETQPRPQPKGGGIKPRSVFLIEGDPNDPGVDIDAKFAELLRTNHRTSGYQPSWPGYGKAANQLTDDDMAKLRRICVDGENMSSLKGVEYAVNLIALECYSNPLLIEFDITKNTSLETLKCYSCNIRELNLSQNTVLKTLECSSNQLNELDVTKNIALTQIQANRNNLSELDVSQNTALTSLFCNVNNLSELDLKQNIALKSLDCGYNKLSKLDVTKNTNLVFLTCNDNHIADITSAYNLNNLSNINAINQQLWFPVPSVSSGGEAIVDILRTTASAGLSASNGNITPSPTINNSGDQILLSNVTRDSLSNKRINFSYDGSQLIEGASSGTKRFSGTINFYTVSDLGSELKPKKKKVKSGEEVEWEWTITGLTNKKAEKVFPQLTLPSGLVIDPSSITKNGAPANIADIDGTNNFGDLNQNETVTFTFRATVIGAVGDWVEAKGHLDWEDDTMTSPYHNETENKIQIQDDEQTYTPKDSNDIALQSVPVYLNHGTNAIMNTTHTYHLSPLYYQSNTKVATDGFYTRIKDDRTTSTGWKLTAKLSEFKDKSNLPMPNGAGISLKIENLSIERVANRDTPQEVIDPTPTGADVPSNVVSSETLIAGDSTAKTLVSAQAGEGQGTWQLRMPFDDISLTLPSGAGKSNTDYTAKLTWSLDNTP